MPTFDNIGLEEPSTITAVVATVVMARGSTNEQQEIQCLGDPETSNAIARVLNSAPASTSWALAIREVSPSTVFSISTGSVRVHQSTASDLQVTATQGGTWSVTASTGSVRVHQSTAADLNVTVAGYVAPSTVVSISTGSVRVHQSSAADLNVTVAGYSTVVSVSTGSVRVQQSSAADLQVTARPIDYDSTYASGSKASSGDTTILSSAASTRFCVTGYHFTIDSTTPTLVRLLDGSTVEMARWQFRAPSSIAAGANLAVGLPSYLYRTAVANPLVLYTDSTATLHYSVQAYRAS